MVTPEITYVNYTLERIAYRRSNTAGANMYVVEIPLKEVRGVSAQYTVSNRGAFDQTKNPDATPPVDGGKVQATTPDVSTLQSLVNKAPALADKATALIQRLLQ